MPFGSTAVYILLLLVPLFWGGAFAVTKHVLTELPPLTISAVRFSLAGLILLGWMLYKREWKAQPVKLAFLPLLALGLSGVFFYNYFFATALQYTSSVQAALVIVVNPVFTACAAILLFGEAWNWRVGLGVLLSLAGVLFVVTKGDFSQFSLFSWGLGELYCLGSVASWVIYTLLAKQIMKKMSSLLMTTVSTVLGATMLAVVAGIKENQWELVWNLSRQASLEMLYLAVFPSVVAFILYNWGIQRIGATKTSAYINLMPVNALWIAALFYGETVTLAHLTGMVLTISGVVLTTQSGRTQVLARKSEAPTVANLTKD